MHIIIIHKTQTKRFPAVGRISRRFRERRVVYEFFLFFFPSGDPGRWSARVSAEIAVRESGGRPESDRRVEGANDEKSLEVRLRAK